MYAYSYSEICSRMFPVSNGLSRQSIIHRHWSSWVFGSGGTPNFSAGKLTIWWSFLGKKKSRFTHHSAAERTCWMFRGVVSLWPLGFALAENLFGATRKWYVNDGLNTVQCTGLPRHRRDHHNWDTFEIIHRSKRWWHIVSWGNGLPIDNHSSWCVSIVDPKSGISLRLPVKSEWHVFPQKHGSTRSKCFPRYARVHPAGEIDHEL